MEIFTFFSGFSGLAGYVLVLATLIICGFGVPIPEDIILISGGYLAAAAGHSPWAMVATGLAGIMLGDSIIFWLGRRFGLTLASRTILRHYLTPERLARVERLFRRHGEKVLVAARFMPGVRAVAFFSAGAMRVPYWHFVLLDGLAALVSAPLWVLLGHRFGVDVVEWAKRSQWVLLASGVTVLVLYGLWRLWAARSTAPRRAAAPKARLQANPEIAD